MSDVLHLRFLGVGNAAAHELGNAAAVLEDDVGAPLLLIDCGPTVLPGYVDQYATLPEALFITHTHLDHVGGLENLFYRLACEQTALPPVRLYVPAAIVERLHRLLGEEPFKLAEGGMNFWDRFQLVPVGDHFWHAGRLFDVFTVDHHGYRSAFGLALADYFLYTGDTRPIADVLARFAAAGERVFHDCALDGNPSHAGIDDIERCYPHELRERLVLYHYESELAAAQLRRHGYEVAVRGGRYKLDPIRPDLRRAG
ncbi:MAG: MBL fold metallo-hydrolase [Chromatiaceae bacterium]|nr:MBL fold metallo-hydrolase [Gammaproteobacteria bacterium]MCP5300900.1 MBL fold metallo-hydrolase [Chromatiaceae bacterium]MCP5421627.1 MBL fold metallo-hydrolase [Chromatiaceae bacterium]